jgi:hypothetical protein
MELKLDLAFAFALVGIMGRFYLDTTALFYWALVMHRGRILGVFVFLVVCGRLFDPCFMCYSMLTNRCFILNFSFSSTLTGYAFNLVSYLEVKRLGACTGLVLIYGLTCA